MTSTRDPVPSSPPSEPIDVESTPSTDEGWRPTPQWYFAEILVVVVGVIIALAANAWWEGWREDEIEREVLQAVQQELTRNHAVLEDALLQMDECLDRTDRFLRMSPSALGEMPANTGLSWVRALSCRRTFDPTLEAAGALGGAPGLDSVDDLMIRTAVASWVRALSDAEEEKLQLSMHGDRVYELLTPYAGAFLDEGLAAFPSIPRIVARGGLAVLAELRRDGGLMGAVIHKAHYLQAYRQELSEARTAADSALALLAGAGYE